MSSTLKQLAELVADLEQRVADLEQQLASAVNRDPRPRDVAEEDRPLADALRQWRREVAAERDIKPYAVFGDRILAAIATIKPVDRFDLSQIRGWGPDRMEKYASEVIGIVRMHTTDADEW